MACGYDINLSNKVPGPILDFIGRFLQYDYIYNLLFSIKGLRKHQTFFYIGRLCKLSLLWQSIQGIVKGAQEWDIRRRDFYTNQTCMDRGLTLNKNHY